MAVLVLATIGHLDSAPVHALAIKSVTAALAESELSGAMSSLATAAAAVLTSLLAATYIPFLLELLRY